MATYEEIYDLSNDTTLLERTAVACVVAADVISQEAGTTNNNANRLIWAKAAMNNPKAMARGMLMAILAQNKGLTKAQIQGANDAALQTGVTNAIDLFADGV